MKIGILKERAHGEFRIAISPDVTKLFVKKGYKVFVEKNAGLAAGFSNDAYTESGGNISSVPLEIISDADLILKVQPSPLIDEINEIDLAKEKAIIIGLLAPWQNSRYLSKLAKKHLSAISMELVPRITKAQNIDVLSSQSNLAGYRAVIEASYHLNRAFPMMITAAGTIHAAKVLILGVGVAGLQAIATAKRLGASVSAYDVRKETKEQVESLGAKFISPDIVDATDKHTVYAKEMSDEYKIKQEEFLSGILKNYDIIIATAQIPGKKAPILITNAMLNEIKRDLIIVDAATAGGGNVEDAISDDVKFVNGVKIIGCSNLASKIASDSSKLYAKNLYNFIENLVKNGKFDFEDEIVKQMLLIREGQVINASF